MTHLTTWKPVRRLGGLRDRMDQVYQDWPFFLGPSTGDEETLRGAWVPPVDVRENAEKIEVTAELPGIDPADVDVSVQGNVLTMRGERRREEVKDTETVHRVEREYGVFERSFSLPRSADSEKIQAKYKDGVLSLTVPKREEAKPKSLRISVER